MTDRTASWFIPVLTRPEPWARLFVLPHAGAGPAAAGALAAAMPAGVEVWALNLPGRQARQDEPPCTDLTGLIGELTSWLRRHGDLPYALFGYCGGALLGYLAAAGAAPRSLFVSGFAAPDVAVVPRRLSRFPSGLFWEVVLEQGGVSPELAELTELRPVFEPALRADFGLYAQYLDHAAPLDVPVHVLHGRTDTSISRGGLLGWRRRTTRPLRLAEMPGGHWLLDDAADGVAGYVYGVLSAELGPAGDSR